MSKSNSTVTTVLTTKCTIVDASSDIQTIREIFDFFPNHFLPVVDGLRFVGVILREDFLKQYMFTGDNTLSAPDLISKEMVTLSPKNTLSEAKEIFDAYPFDVIPVTDADGDLVGVVLRTELEKSLRNANPLTTTLRKIMTFLSFH